MPGIEDSLMQLRRRIAEARRGSADPSRDAQIAELTQRFAELEAQLFSEQPLRREAHAIHQRTQRRRRQQQQQQKQKQREKEKEKERGWVWERPLRRAASDAGNGEAPRALRAPSASPRDADPLPRAFMDLTCSGSGSGGDEGPQRSFAQAFAEDDRPRLLFVIDELSRVLRGERSRGDALQRRVVPMLVRHIEAMERDAAQQRREIAALRRELALQVELSRLVETASGESDSEGRSRGQWGEVERRVKAVVERCEQQLRRLEAQ